MIQIIKADGFYRSIVQCDVCLEPITDANMAVAVRFSHGSVWHLHKGECHDRAERMVPVFRQGFMELQEHIEQIDHNTRLPAEQANTQPCQTAVSTEPLGPLVPRRFRRASRS